MIPLLLASTLVACGGGSDEPDASPPVAAGQFLADEGRGGMCVGSEGDAAFILYGEGDANCLAEGTITANDEGATFTPLGDKTCTVGLQIDGDRITFADGGGSCSYYCGGDASLAERTVSRSESAEPLTDIAGDPLC